MDDCQLFSDAEWKVLSRKLNLTPQQSRVARCVVGGMCDKQIAGQLRIKLTTVRMHMGKLFAKLNVQDRTELVIQIFQQFRSLNLS